MALRTLKSWKTTVFGVLVFGRTPQLCFNSGVPPSPLVDRIPNLFQVGTNEVAIKNGCFKHHTELYYKSLWVLVLTIKGY